MVELNCDSTCAYISTGFGLNQKGSGYLKKKKIHCDVLVFSKIPWKSISRKFLEREALFFSSTLRFHFSFIAF